ncbi:MAG: EutN/CcmL family microcompartment protein [bacterium]|jgi:microcompartment protein CcmK/EutM|nr:EutN/CcmL family microcompartment protein [bacterium]
MRLARVIGTAVSTLKHDAYKGRKLLLVEPISPEGKAIGPATLAVDYVGAGEGEYILVGAAPGVAKDVFEVDIAPINDLVMGIIDEVEIDGKITLRANQPNPTP